MRACTCYIRHNICLQVNREYVLECYLHIHPVLREVQECVFEPYGQDTVTAISRDHGAEIFLDKDARKWANKLTKDQRSIVSLQKQVKGLQSVTSAYTKVSAFSQRSFWCNVIFVWCVLFRIRNLVHRKPMQRRCKRPTCCWRRFGSLRCRRARQRQGWIALGKLVSM